MNEIIKSTIEGLKSTPVLLVMVLLNCVMLAGFGYVLHEISSATDRRQELIKTCIDYLAKPRT